MKKLLSIPLVLLFSACGSQLAPATKQIEQTDNIPPSVTLTQNAATFESAIGGYCYDGTCVDKAAAKKLIQNMDFQSISSDALGLVFEEAPLETNVGVLSEFGEMTLCYVELNELSPLKYQLNLCGSDEDKFILQISLHYKNGNATYYFPLKGH